MDTYRDQNVALRQKFVSVLPPVIASGDEDNIGALLSSLANICRPDAGLLIPSLENNVEETETSEFICWLISELLTINTSNAEEASINLQINIFQLVAVRNYKLFPSLLKDFIEIVKDGTNIIFDGGQKLHHCFGTVIDRNKANLIPKDIMLKDSDTLDHLLARVIKVLGNLGSYVLLYGREFLKDLWTVLGLCLEGGATCLKIASLASLSKLMDSCCFPSVIETQDYILQLIGECAVGVARGDFAPAEQEKNLPLLRKDVTKLEKNLSEVIGGMRRRLDSLFPCVLQDVASHLEQFLHYTHRFTQFDNCLLDELLLLTCDVLAMQNNFPSLANSVEGAVSQALGSPQVIKVCLKMLVISELDKMIPEDIRINKSGVRKRTHFQSQHSSLEIEGWSASLWLGKANDFISQLVNQMNEDSVEGTLPFERLEIIAKYLELFSEVSSHYSSISEVYISFLPDDLWLSLHTIVVSSFFQEKLTGIENVLKLYSFLNSLIFVIVSNKASSSAILKPIFQTWIGIGSLPWIGNEMNWLDLKPENKNAILSVASRAAWINESEIKSSCVPILALSFRHVAPSWRSYVIRAMLNEGEKSVLATVAQWLPVLLHQLPPSSSKALLPECVGKLLSTEHVEVLTNLASSLRRLFCVISNQTHIRPMADSAFSPNCLYCQMCDSGAGESRDSKAEVDSALVQRFFPLMERPQKEIVCAFLSVFPALASHCSLNPKSFLPLMELLVHEDEQVCDEFAQRLGVFLSKEMGNKDEDDFSLENQRRELSIESCVLSYLKDLVIINEESQAKRLKKHRNILQVLSHFTKIQDQCFEEEVLSLFVRFIGSSDRETAAFASLSISEWAQSQNLNPKQLYLRNRKALAQVISEVAKDGEIGLVLSQLAEVFCWGFGREQRGGWVSFGVSQLPYLLPPLVLRSLKEDKPSLLQEVTALLGIGLRDMLIDHFQHILAYFVFYCSKEEKEKVLSFISSTTSIHIEGIRKCSVQNQVNELILGLHNYKEAVLNEFLEIKVIEGEHRKDPEKMSSSEKLTCVGDFLAPRLLGIFGFLDGKLVSSQTLRSEREAAVLSLIELLGVIGNRHVSSVARKVLASLKMVMKLKERSYFKMKCQAFASFLNSLDESTLESVIEEVIILCLPLLRHNPELLAPVLKTILLETACVRSILQYLPLLPQHPSLSSINESLMKAQSHFEGNKESVVRSLESVRRCLTHESQDVRLHSLKRLKSILLKNQTIVHQLILDSDKAHVTVSDIFTALLGQCRENEELHLLVAECLGLFGAIDPARLLSDTTDKNKLSEIYSNIESERFVIDLVMELARAFLSATDASTQTCASYAMQEIIRLYKIGLSPGRSLGGVVYSKLPPNILEIMKPLQNSKYTVSSNRQKSTSLPSPIYRSKYSKTFSHWVSNWTCSLADLLVGEFPKQVYTACKPLIRRDASTALHLLPPLIICVLTEAESNRVPVSTEILSIIETGSDDKAEPSVELQQLAVQTIFSCLDYVKRWSQAVKQQETSYKKNRVIFSPSIELQYVIDFLDQIPADALASASFKSQAYSRALLHLESYLAKNPNQLKANLSFLQSIYVALDDPDGVAGVASVRQDDPSLKEQIIEYEARGRFHDALGSYERLCIAQESRETYEGMLKCYLSLGQPQSVLNITQGLLARRSELGSSLHEYSVEAAWRLGQWEQLESFLNSNTEQPFSWGVGVGKALLAARERDGDGYWEAIQRLRIEQIAPMSAASMEKGAYQRAYPHILRLQILNELEEMLSGVLKIPLMLSGASSSESQTPLERCPSLTLKELSERWNNRFLLVQTSHRFLEPLLHFRRTLLAIGQDWTKESNPSLSQFLSGLLEQTWLQSAKVARKAGHFQQGEIAFYGAGRLSDVFMERAKWHWAKGEQPQAVAVLKRGIQRFFPNTEALKSNPTDNTLPDRQTCAAAKLLLARYSEESATLDVQTIKTYYRDVCDIYRNWEDGHFNLAMYYDRILSTLEMKDKPADWFYHIVQSFGKSLNYGCHHIYQSMPRLLTLWLDHGAKVVEMERLKANSSTLNAYTVKLASMNTFLGQILERLPNYMFLIALPQLISRICHSHNGVFSVLSKIIATLLTKYPQQSMWHLIAVSKSSYQTRQERCLQIIEMAKTYKPTLEKFFADTTKLADLFIELADKQVEKGVQSLSLGSIMRALPRLLSNSKFSNIILPLQQQMNVVLPSIRRSSDANNLKTLHDHNPFPREEVYLSGIEDEVEIMQSLVQPKKLTLKGSNGLKYIIMCKPKDDMRKDCRLMEFNSLVNMLLTKDPESRKRDLKIRTYMVVPLNEECGLVEWIPNLCGLRQILHKLYRENGMYVSGHELRNLMCHLEDSLSQKRDVFLNKLLTRHPPVFSNWFLLTFVDSEAWLRARWSYCRTTAVMSMVGYIVGLGDRHGENILFDSECGDIVHVDFNCLFNKGESFDWPERVPFRLTHNMVSAMGPTGYEGIFRKSCEVTMRVMRKERDELMSVLRPFIYDPLVEWEKERKPVRGAEKGARDKVKGTGEICNAKAQTLVKNIEERLSGQIRRQASGVHLPLSVEGQVNVLIEDATSIDNLCQMYLGWAPFM